MLAMKYRCFDTLEPYVDTDAANFLFHAPVSLDWVSRGLLPLCIFLIFPWLWLRIEVALITSLHRQSFVEGLKSWFLLSLVSPG